MCGGGQEENKERKKEDRKRVRRRESSEKIAEFACTQAQKTRQLWKKVVVLTPRSVVANIT